MAERLVELMRAEADALDIPPPPLNEILHAGRGGRRRRRLQAALGAVAAAIVVGALVVVPALRFGSDRGDGSVAVHERSDAIFSDAQADAVQRAYARGGAFAVGSRVYFGNRDYGVEIGDPAVRGLYYTSAGVLVRHGKDYAMDGSSRDGYSLVATDGSVTGLDLDIGDVSPSTDPTQPFFAYARPSGDHWEVVILDLRTGESTAIVKVDGAFSWGGWDAPPVALSGDLVYVGLDDATVAVNWRTAEVTRTPLPASSYPDVNAGRYLEVENGESSNGLEASVRVRDARSGETLLDLPEVGDRWASLSPDGDHVLVLPFLLVGDNGQIQRTAHAVLYSVETGEQMPLPASPVGGYGWTPDGLVFSMTPNAVTLCDGDSGGCSTTPLDLALTTDDADTIRLGGMVNDS